MGKKEKKKKKKKKQQSTRHAPIRIHRVSKAEGDHSGFAQIDNRTIRDPRLSWRALGLLVYLLSLPDPWNFKSTHLATKKVDGVEATRSTVNELRRFGYVRRIKLRGEGGRFLTVNEVYENPDENPDIDPKVKGFWTEFDPTAL